MLQNDEQPLLTGRWLALMTLTGRWIAPMNPHVLSMIAQPSTIASIADGPDRNIEVVYVNL